MKARRNLNLAQRFYPYCSVHLQLKGISEEYVLAGRERNKDPPNLRLTQTCPGGFMED